MNPVIELSAFSQKVKLTPTEKTPQETIMKALVNLDNVAVELKKKLIFVIDEVQQIAELSEYGQCPPETLIVFNRGEFIKIYLIVACGRALPLVERVSKQVKVFGNAATVEPLNSTLSSLMFLTLGVAKSNWPKKVSGTE